MSNLTKELIYDLEQIIRDHQLQPRIRSSEGAPKRDYECLCSLKYFGVAEWSQHVTRKLITKMVEHGVGIPPSPREVLAKIASITTSSQGVEISGHLTEAGIALHLAASAAYDEDLPQSKGD